MSLRCFRTVWRRRKHLSWLLLKALLATTLHLLHLLLMHLLPHLLLLHLCCSW